MKRGTHFLAGLCVSSFFPEAVAAAVDGSPLYFMLGSGMALLPDMIDSNMTRFFYPVDIIITPDSSDADAKGMARRLVSAVRQVITRGFPLSVRLDPIQMPEECCLPYRITFDAAEQTLIVVIETLCDRDGNPVKNTLAPVSNTTVVALPARIHPTYDPSVTVTNDEVTIQFSPTGDGRVNAAINPWHRVWSHSIPIFGLLAAAVSLIGGFTAGLIVFISGVSHSFLDQLGHMGSVLKWPFSRVRILGMRCGYATDPWQNLAIAWACILITGLNLARLDPEIPALFNPLRYLMWGWIIPFLIHRRIFTSKKGSSKNCACSYDVT